ncbi:hypothetical protein [Janthinobacterium sp. B9-8]|uniref:hypothetical protein n=1 Tax=Janthinobacterium sp. B9-8 TaxID=1236179 RepID=UPI00061CF7AE|nr:hypothetical protein [Janthinobacterium sp. B9-8]AMC35364.1 hypothetical protein VN23_12455 [Janthinobacterium sp. B9-8]
MHLINKLSEKMMEHIAEAAIASVSVLLVFAAKELSPIVLPLIESKLSNQTLLSLFLASLAINLILAVLIYVASKKPDFNLKYGIYWDSKKNPHCPACQKPVAGYSDYGASGKGYYCKPCKQIFPLTDVSGNDISPSQAISEL